jgi:hypothetical protein
MKRENNQHLGNCKIDRASNVIVIYGEERWCQVRVSGV